MYVDIYTHICIHIYIRKCIFIYMFMHLGKGVRVIIPGYGSLAVSVCMYLYIYTHVYICTNMSYPG